MASSEPELGLSYHVTVVLSIKPAAPNLFGTWSQFYGRQVFHRQGQGG